MGIAYNPTTNVLTCVGTTQQVITIDSAVGDITLNTIDTPNYQGSLSQAYMEMKVNFVENINVADNSLGPATQEIQIRDSSLVYRDAISFSNLDMFTKASSTRGYSVYWGNHDLSSYLEPDTTYSVKWNDADANLDSLVLYGLQCRLILYIL